jgi:isoleucyl-tRNA synthetase
LGLLVDGEGQKMSKSLGNVIDPWALSDRQGADAVRWYFFSAGQPWTPRRVFEDAIRESTRQTLLTLWNCTSFFATYADLDGWEPEATPLQPTHLLDRWILSELDTTIATVTSALDGFDALSGCTRLAQFIDDLSNWYVRRSRQRFWKASDPVAHATLHRCLVVTAQLLAPFCPMLADDLYLLLTAPVGGAPSSVHLSDWPEPGGWSDPALAERVAASRRLVALGRAARTDAGVKVRQPLRRALLLHPGAQLDDAARAEIAGELNVKRLEDVDTLSGLMSWTVVPNFRALGPRLGPKVPEVKAALAIADGNELQRQLETDGFIEVAGERLTRDEVDVRATRHESFALAEEGGWAVALDLDLDDDLRAEGSARELVRAINDLRKDVGLDIADRIRLRLDADGELGAAIEVHRDYIASEVLATELTVTTGSGGDHHLDVDGAPLAASLERA